MNTKLHSKNSGKPLKGNFDIWYIMSQSGKLQKDVEATTANKLLVICIDRDDDLGRKTGLPTPVVGRNACIEAAQRLALEDPEDADSN